jgi:hypothetical protein
MFICVSLDLIEIPKTQEVLVSFAPEQLINDLFPMNMGEGRGRARNIFSLSFSCHNASKLSLATCIPIPTIYHFSCCRSKATLFYLRSNQITFIKCSTVNTIEIIIITPITLCIKQTIKYRKQIERKKISHKAFMLQ